MGHVEIQCRLEIPSRVDTARRFRAGRMDNPEICCRWRRQAQLPREGRQIALCARIVVGIDKGNRSGARCDIGGRQVRIASGHRRGNQPIDACELGRRFIEISRERRRACTGLHFGKRVGRGHQYPDIRVSPLAEIRHQHIVRLRLEEASRRKVGKIIDFLLSPALGRGIRDEAPGEAGEQHTRRDRSRPP